MIFPFNGKRKVDQEKCVCETATFNARNILKCIYTYITWQFSLRIYSIFLIP